MVPRMVALDAATLKLPSDAWSRLSTLGDLNLYEDTKTPEEVIERAKVIFNIYCSYHSFSNSSRTPT